MPPDFSANMPPAPSGHLTAVVHQYYAWLYANYLASIPAERTNIMWSGPFYIFFFIFILSAFLIIYAGRAVYVHRKKGELYGVGSFGGYILERIGPVELFTWATIVVMLLWALYFLITQAIWGQVY